MRLGTHLRKLRISQSGCPDVPAGGSDMGPVMNVTSPTVVPLLPSVTRRVGLRLLVVAVGLSLLLGSAFEAGAASARPADAVKSATTKKKKKKRAVKKAPCTRWHKVRLKRHGHYVRRHGRIVRVRHCVSRKKRQAATAPPATTAPK